MHIQPSSECVAGLTTACVHNPPYLWPMSSSHGACLCPGWCAFLVSTAVHGMQWNGMGGLGLAFRLFYAVVCPAGCGLLVTHQSHGKVWCDSCMVTCQASSCCGHQHRGASGSACSSASFQMQHACSLTPPTTLLGHSHQGVPPGSSSSCSWVAAQQGMESGTAAAVMAAAAALGHLGRLWCSWVYRWLYCPAVS